MSPHRIIRFAWSTDDGDAKQTLNDTGPNEFRYPTLFAQRLEVWAQNMTDRGAQSSDKGGSTVEARAGKGLRTMALRSRVQLSRERGSESSARAAAQVEGERRVLGSSAAASASQSAFPNHGQHLGTIVLWVCVGSGSHVHRGFGYIHVLFRTIGTTSHRYHRREWKDMQHERV